MWRQTCQSAQSRTGGEGRHRADPRRSRPRRSWRASFRSPTTYGRESGPPEFLGCCISHTAETAVTQEYVGKLRIKCSSGAQLAGRLSGGNQQKVVIAKWLARGAKIFLFDEPTRGIDVGAKVEVFEVMDGLARAGAAILMVSSELPELLQVPDRILVMRQGRLDGRTAARIVAGRDHAACGFARENGQELTQ